MKNRLISITQTLIILLIISLIYQFDKVKSASSKSQLDTIRMLVKFSDSYNNQGARSNEMDEAIRKWLVQNDEANYELNLKAREVISKALNEVGVDTTQISEAKDIDPIRGGVSFITSRIAIDPARFDRKYQRGDVGRAIEDYRSLTKKLPVSVLSKINPKEIDKKLSRFKSVQNGDPFDELLEEIKEQEEFNFMGCYIKKDSLVISYRKPQPQHFQVTLQRSRLTIPATTTVVGELSHFDLIPKSNLRELSADEIHAIEKYDDQSIEELEEVLVSEYLHAFGKVEVLGFQLSNQSFSTVILFLLFILSGMLLLTLKQLKGKVLDTSDSENIFTVFIEIGWLRKLAWIVLPLIINSIALFHSYDSGIYWMILCICAIFSMYFMLLSVKKLEAIYK